jgi:enoyl-[acyl-carrier protein] reductase II
MFHTVICDMLGIKYPIIQGGMAWASDHRLTAAVSNAGGLGLIAAGNIPDKDLAYEIRETRRLTDKPFGVNMVPIAGVQLTDRIKTVLDEGVDIVATAFSDPTMPVISELHKHPITVLCVVPSVRLAKRVEQEGADIIVASGMEAGGHVGKIATLPLVPQVVDAVKVPVVAAGGIGDGRGLLAALSLGASGIQMGTRFMATVECVIHPSMKALIVEATEEDTVVTGNVTGSPARCLRNEFTDYWLSKEKEKGHMAKEELQREGLGRLRRGLLEGDLEQGTLPGGQVCGLVREIRSVKEIIDSIISEAESMYNKIGALNEG